MHTSGCVPGGHDIDTDVAQLALETARAERQHAPDPGFVPLDVKRGRSRRRDDTIRRDGTAHPAQAGHVVGPVMHRVVGDVYDLVAAAGTRREQRGDTGDGFRAAIDDTVEIDEKEQAHTADRSRRPGSASEPRTIGSICRRRASR